MNALHEAEVSGGPGDKTDEDRDYDEFQREDDEAADDFDEDDYPEENAPDTEG